MEDSRPQPEEILRQINEANKQAALGKLKVFLGAAPGVGKTYTMLEAARKLISSGVDVEAGVVVTHGRAETEALLHGIKVIPLAHIVYQNRELEEFDLDAALVRKPKVVLVDELAHTNAPGCRHEKRWQDVEELLNAGIDVFTTLNIQHLESVNDVVSAVTGIVVRETVPDSVLERAYEVEMVDLPPDDLIERLKEGKVYVPEQSKVALENFFRKGNLIALRELALRVTAERVDAQMQTYRREASIKEVWPTSEKILVCVSASPLSAKLVRAAKRLATGLHAEWLAVSVETARTEKGGEENKKRTIRTLQLAEKLGAETVVLTGSNAAEEIVTYASKRNVSKIVIGKPARPRWQEILFGSVVDDLIRRSGDIDVYVISGEKQDDLSPILAQQTSNFDSKAYLAAVLNVTAATIVARLAFGFLSSANLIMIYLLAVVLTAIRFGRGPAILSAFLGVLLYDFFFVPPYFSFAVTDTQYVFTFAVMLIVGVLMSTLTSTVRAQARLARKRERQTAALYAMSKEHVTARTKEQVIEISGQHIASLFDCKVAIFLMETEHRIACVYDITQSFNVDGKELGVAQWVFLNGQPAGVGTQTLRGARGSYLPMRASTSIVGVLGVLPKDPNRFDNPEEMRLIETFVNQTALAVERAWTGEH